MSSPSPASQVIDAQTSGAAPKTVVLVAHGQPSAPNPPEHSLAQLAEQVASFLPGWQVRSATLAQPGRLEQVVQPGALVYPFFMAEGWFTGKVLPKRICHVDHRQLPPFGQDPNLPELAARLVRQARTAQGQPFEAASGSASDSGSDPSAPGCLLLAAHGSARGPKAAAATELFATALRPLLPELEVRTAYIEQAPYLADVASNMPSDGLCLPFFAQSGDHVKDDIPEALSSAKFDGTVLPALGTTPEVARLIAKAIQRA
ncbi:CbiX/SirB N-terminal domain-containing protein [Pseudophaeobacter sp.]|jgi:sirohydrochlorin ferrochelatase|uniref:CbiX/SirB N-terminal domain-containing protein n=1 Tax=Pseudophaeobacter sp. TaxID=1971739 RepID=UPI0032659BCC